MLRFRLLGCLLAMATVAPVPAFAAHPSESASRETIALREAWRAGADDDDLFFGDIQQVIADADGNLLLVDKQRCCIEVFAVDGTHLRTLSREGEGPGEVRGPYGACVLPDGGIAMPQRFAGKVVVIEPDGSPREVWDLFEHYYTVNTVMSGGGGLLVAGQYNEPLSDGQVQHFVLAGHDLDGRRRCVYVEKTNTLNYHPLNLDEAGSYCARQRRCAIGPDGRVYAATSRNEYRIEVFRPDGSADGVVTRAFEPWSRTAAERDRNRAILEDDVRNIDLPKEFTVEANEPAIDYLHVDAAGRLWVQHGRSWRGRDPGVLVVFDVFDPTGRLEREVELRGPGDLADDLVWILDDGRFVLVVGGVGGQRAVDEEFDDGEPVQVVMLETESSLRP